MRRSRNLRGKLALATLLAVALMGASYQNDAQVDADVSTHAGTADAHHAATVAGDLDGDVLTPTSRVNSYTTSQTLSATDTHCSVVTNDGATGGITLTLPEAETGLCVLVILAEAQDVDVDPPGSAACTLGVGCDQIIGETSTPGESLSSDATVGSLLSLVGLNANEWLVTGKAGTWTEEVP